MTPTHPKTKREEWEKEFHKEWKFHNMGGTHIWINRFVRKVRTQAIEEERERIREIIKNSDYGDGSCDTNDLLTHLNKK
jgi:hypothetical protein